MSNSTTIKEKVFQFSNIKNVENYQKIKKIFNDLKIDYEDCKVCCS